MQIIRWFIWIAVLYLMTSCQSESALSRQMEAQLNVIVNDKNAALSSNPQDYLNKHPEAYQSIINTGPEGLAYFVAQLRNSEENGLKEWIMAKACEGILQDRNPVASWSTGKEWLAKYEATK